MENIIDNYKHSLIRAITQLDTYKEVRTAALLMLDTIQNGGTIYTCGNGGSASTASHMVCDIGKNTGKNVKIVCLNDSISTVMAYANDLEYDAVFSEQLAKVISEEDCLVAISTSGKSMNVLAAISVAVTFNASVVALTGINGNSMMAKMLARPAYPNGQLIFVESDNIGVVEDVHLIVNHMITEILRAM